MAEKKYIRLNDAAVIKYLQIAPELLDEVYRLRKSNSNLSKRTWDAKQFVENIDKVNTELEETIAEIIEDKNTLKLDEKILIQMLEGEKKITKRLWITVLFLSILSGVAFYL